MENEQVWFLIENDHPRLWVPREDEACADAEMFETLGVKFIAYSRRHPPGEEEWIIDEYDLGCDA